MIFGKHINKYYLKYLHFFLFGILALIAVDVCQLKIPELYNYLINGVNTGEVTLKNGEVVPFNFAFLLDQICLPMLIIVLAMVFGRFLWRICFFGVGVRIETNLRFKMFDKCKNLSQQYYQVNKVGNLMSLFTNDIETVQDCFGMGVLTLCDAVFLGGLSLIKMANMNLALTLFSLIPMSMMLAVSIIVGKYMQSKWKVRQEAFSSLSDFSQESFSGIAVIKAFVKETKELLAFKKLNKENEDSNVNYTKASTLLRIFITLFIESVICLILGYGGYLVYKGIFNAGQLMEFIGYFNAIIWPVMAVSELIEMRSRGKASLTRISELLDAKQDVIDKPEAIEVENLSGAIEFKNLTFRYPDGDYDALKNVNLTINAGENVGIIGKTGSGKTTLVDLILRNYNVPDNTLFIDGHDVNDITIHSVRENSAYVPQDNFLFSDTIANNICFASDSDDNSLIQNAAKMAVVSDNIEEFNDGYQTMLGERGVTVSGGQKQRISIARALMKNAPLLILDDSLSAVDTKTEKTLLDNLHELRMGKTTILIAHRISTILQMDKIVFIDDGEIVAVGTHDKLLSTCKEYFKMVELQKLEEEKEG
ncbi:MAG: ABC transporter ATP-binding protein [Clostridia bacterium]|nr:ABC transporter ATP-binding protein [Clostridia bacterium]